MSIPIYAYVIEKFFTEVLDPILKLYVYDGYTALANHLRVPLGAAVILFITILGLSIMQGWAKLSLGNFVKIALKLGLIYTFAMHWAIFSQYIVAGIEGSAGHIGDWLIQATPIPIPQFAGTHINGALQSVLIEITKIGTWVWRSGGSFNLGPYVTAILIFAFGYAMLLVAIFEIVLAKIMLAILFTTAPLFIAFTLFKPTHGYFDRWLGLIAGYAFLLIFISAVLALVLNFAQWAIGDMYLNPPADFSLVSFVPAMMVCFIGIGIMLKVAQLAQSIGGAVTTTSGSELLAGTLGGVVGAGLSTAGMGKSILSSVGGVSGGINKLGQFLGEKTTNASAAMMKGIQSRLQRGE